MKTITDLKIQDVYKMMKNGYKKFYNPTVHLAVDKITVFFKGRVVSKQDILKKYKCFGVKNFKLRDFMGYTCDMKMYVWRTTCPASKHRSTTGPSEEKSKPRKQTA
jgi:hypothetical protein